MSSSDPSSFSKELEGVRAGNPAATDRMVQRYWGRLVALLRPRVRWYGRPAVSVDEDDVANAALNSVIGRVRSGKVAGITDRNGFWRMLALVATRKAGRVVKRWHRRPNARPVYSAGEFGGLSASISGRVASREECARLIEALRAYQPARSEHARGDELAELVRLLGDGYDIPQIAERLNVARCTVYRWIQIVKKIGENIGIAIQTSEPAP